MKILIKGDSARYERYSPGLSVQQTAQITFIPRAAASRETPPSDPAARLR